MVGSSGQSSVAESASLSHSHLRSMGFVPSGAASTAPSGSGGGLGSRISLRVWVRAGLRPKLAWPSGLRDAGILPSVSTATCAVSSAYVRVNCATFCWSADCGCGDGLRIVTVTYRPPAEIRDRRFGIPGTESCIVPLFRITGKSLFGVNGFLGAAGFVKRNRSAGPGGRAVIQDLTRKHPYSKGIIIRGTLIGKSGISRRGVMVKIIIILNSFIRPPHAG